MSGDFFPSLVPYGNDLDTQTEAGKPLFKSPDEYMASVMYWTEAAWEEAKADQADSEELKQVQTFVDYLRGKQWGGNRPTYKSKPINNRMARLWREMIGFLTDIRPMIEIRATDPNYNTQAEFLNKSLKAWWLGNDVDLNLAFCIMYAMLTTGFAKVAYNPEIDDIEFEPLGPMDILPLKATTSLSSAQAVIRQAIRPLAELKRQYPLRGHMLRPDDRYSKFEIIQSGPANVSPRLYQMLSPAMQRTLKPENRAVHSAFPMVHYREFWFKDHTVNDSNVTVLMGRPGTNWCYKVAPGQPLYPRGRLIVKGGPIVLYDGPNPYWHGNFPFACLRLSPVPWQFYGYSEMRSWVDLQDIVNNIYAGVMDVIKKATNPSFYAPKNAFTENVWTQLDFSQPGARAAYNPQVAHEPKFVSPPQLGGYVLPFLMQAEREMDQESIGSAINQALSKKQVPGGDSLEMMKNTQSTPVRLKGRYTEVFLRDAGKMVIPNQLQFYTTKRRLQMAGSAGVLFQDVAWEPGTMMPESVRDDPSEYVKNFVFMIEPGSLLNISRVEKATIAMRLRGGGDIDRRSMYKILDANVDVDEVERNLSKERENNLGPAIGKKGMAGVKK